MARSSRILIAAAVAVSCSLCAGREANAQSIRIRTSDDESTALVRTMLERISTNEPELAARGDVAAWGPGFKRFAEGECDILVSGVFPDAADMKHLSWTLPVGSRLQEFVAGQQRVLVVVNKANPVNSVSLKQLAKMVGPSDEPAVWSDVGAEGGQMRIWMEPAKSPSVFVIRKKCLRKAAGGAVTIQDIRKEVKHCADGKAVVDAVRRSRNGIGFVSDPNVTLAEVKVLAVVDAAGRPVQPLPGPVFQKDYPLSRWLLLYLHPKAPDGAKKLCELLCGPVVASVAAGSGT